MGRVNWDLCKQVVDSADEWPKGQISCCVTLPQRKSWKHSVGPAISVGRNAVNVSDWIFIEVINLPGT